MLRRVCPPSNPTSSFFSHYFFPTKMCHTFPLAWYLLRCIDHIRHSCPFLASSVTGSSRNHICTCVFLFLGVRTMPLSMFIFRLFYSPPFKSSVPNTMFLLDISPTATPATARFLIRRTIVVALRKFRLHSVRVVWHTTQADSSSAWLTSCPSLCAMQPYVCGHRSDKGTKRYRLTVLIWLQTHVAFLQRKKVADSAS